MSDKIRVQHLARKAVLYVRQSSAYQVSHNLESQKGVPLISLHFTGIAAPWRHAALRNGPIKKSY
ncbi:hypothetical protein SAMN05414139_10280 [Burkholderia sp. D7]|nr:hypothetical protein SAMN05414139_10280 [Burkholderia sp. D7]